MIRHMKEKQLQPDSIPQPDKDIIWSETQTPHGYIFPTLYIKRQNNWP